LSLKQLIANNIRRKVMSINTPISPEKREPKYDKKKPATPVEKAVNNTKDKVHKVVNK